MNNLMITYNLHYLKIFFMFVEYFDLSFSSDSNIMWEFINFVSIIHYFFLSHWALSKITTPFFGVKLWLPLFDFFKIPYFLRVDLTSYHYDRRRLQVNEGGTEWIRPILKRSTSSTINAFQDNFFTISLCFLSVS